MLQNAAHHLSNVDDSTTAESEDSDEISIQESAENTGRLTPPLAVSITHRRYENPDILIEVALGGIRDLRNVSSIDRTFVSSVTLPV